MSFGVRGVDKLTGHEAVRYLFCELVSLGYRALHALCALGEHKLGTVCFHQLAALNGHRLGHNDNYAISARGGDGGETDAGVAGGRLNNNRIGGEFARRLRVVEHLSGDSVFDGACGIEILELCEHFRLESVFLFNVGQFEKRGLSYKLVC